MLVCKYNLVSFLHHILHVCHWRFNRIIPLQAYNNGCRNNIIPRHAQVYLIVRYKYNYIRKYFPRIHKRMKKNVKTMIVKFTSRQKIPVRNVPIHVYFRQIENCQVHKSLLFWGQHVNSCNAVEGFCVDIRLSGEFKNNTSAYIGIQILFIQITSIPVNTHFLIYIYYTKLVPYKSTDFYRESKLHNYVYTFYIFLLSDLEEKI